MQGDTVGSNLISDVIAGWRNWREKQKQRGELSNLTEEELTELAADCGVTPRQLLDVVQAGPHAADEMNQLMQALGIDPEHVRQADRAAFTDMQILCAACEAKKQCRHSLAAGIAPFEYDAFCPNAEALAELEKVQTMLRPFPQI